MQCGTWCLIEAAQSTGMLKLNLKVHCTKWRNLGSKEFMMGGGAFRTVKRQYFSKRRAASGPWAEVLTPLNQVKDSATFISTCRIDSELWNLLVNGHWAELFTYECPLDKTILWWMPIGQNYSLVNAHWIELCTGERPLERTVYWWMSIGQTTKHRPVAKLSWMWMGAGVDFQIWERHDQP